MSDLAATNCQSSCNGGCGLGFGNNSFIWIILLLCCCNGNSWNGDEGCGCESIIWIILLLCCCNGNHGGFNCGC